MPDLLVQLLTSASVTGAAIWVIQRYIIGKIGFNFNKKIEELRQQHKEALEKLRPLTAEEIIRRESFIKSKLEIYYEAIEIIYKLAFEYTKYVGSSSEDLPNVKIPNEVEINICAGKLAIFCQNTSVHTLFLKCYKEPTPNDIGRFIASIRKDLGYGETVIPPEQLGYFTLRPS